MTTHHKSAQEENFPVAFCLFPKQHRRLVEVYYRFAREADDIADAPDLTNQKKLAKLAEMADSLYGKSTHAKSAVKLREMFLHEGFDFALAGDLLKAFEQDAKGFEYRTWAQLIAYCRNSAAPVGRFLLAMYGENPSTYLPAEALCAALQIVNHVQDMHSDACKLKRCYMPQEILQKYGAAEADIYGDKMPKGLRLAADDVLDRCEGLLKDAAQLPKIMVAKVLRIEVFVIIYLTKRLIYKLKKYDCLQREVKLSTWDRGLALVAGVVQGLCLKPNVERTDLR